MYSDSIRNIEFLSLKLNKRTKNWMYGSILNWMWKIY